MGLFARLLGREAAPTEQRDMLGQLHGYLPGFNAMPLSSGGYISPVAAENLASIASAVGAISSAIASLQPLAFQRDGAGRAELASPHWLPRLLKEPAPRLPWCDWIESQMAGVLLTGNAIAVVEADSGGRVIALHPVPFSSVSMVRLPNGRPRYDITDHGGAWGRAGGVHRFLEAEIWHLADRREPGELAAKSRLGRVGGAIQNALSLQEMTQAAWRNATHVGGYVSAPQVLTDAQRKLSESLLDRFRGARNAGGTPLLEAGWKWESMNIDAETLETIESRKFSVIEIARTFNIPPPLLQSYENNTFTNAQQASLWYGMFTIAPWVRKIESSIQNCILGSQSDLSVELDMSSLLRGSQSERWEANRAAIELGVVSPDEVRQQEGWGPRKAADAAPAPPAAGEPVAP
jgi:HK97 family phage portal protein